MSKKLVKGCEIIYTNTQIKNGALINMNLGHSEAIARRCSIKMMLLKFLQNSQENTCVRVSFLIKLQVSASVTLLKKRLWHSCFPVNFAKFLRKPVLQSTSG